MANAENTCKRTKNGICVASPGAGLPRKIEATYGVRTSAPHDDPQRYSTAMSTPEAIATNNRARKTVSDNSVMTDRLPWETCCQVSFTQPDSAASPAMSATASNKYSRAGLVFHASTDCGSSRMAACTNSNSAMPARQVIAPLNTLHASDIS